MATNPGFLTHWPWEPLGNFKYAIVGPWAVHSIYRWYGLCTREEIDMCYLSVLPLMLWRMLHNQIWITFSRHRTAKGNNLIVDKSLDFDQVDRESNWDDQILLSGIIFYVAFGMLGQHVRLWRADGLMLMVLLHMGPVEFLYYWFHRALHHHYLYTRYHSHHHSSIVTEPITSVIHPFAEHIAYFTLFSIPILTVHMMGMFSLTSLFVYITYIDLMNNMGHCNFEIIPKWWFTVFPPLKYLMYTPSFHSLHHTQFRTNYSLFMPFYDYIYGTMDKSTDVLHEKSLQKQEEVPNVVHLTHLTTSQSIYHLRLGFASVASKPFTSKWYLWMMWPVTLWSMIVTWIYGRTFIVERNTFEKLKLQSWIVPRYIIHYLDQRQREAINKLVEEAILEANNKGVKVMSLGLLNQGMELNKSGEIYLDKHPDLKVKVVDGSSLAVGVVINSIPKGTSQVLFRGKLCKVAYSIVSTLCHRGIQVATAKKDEYQKLKKVVPAEDGSNLVFLAKSYNLKMWLVSEDLTESEQMMAPKGSIFIPFSQLPPKKKREDCFYMNTPSLIVPKAFENLHSCENWLPRKVMSAWRVAGIIHGLEGWNVNECGDKLFDVNKVWEAALQHGFRPMLPSV